MLKDDTIRYHLREIRESYRAAHAEWVLEKQSNFKKCLKEARNRTNLLISLLEEGESEPQ